MSINTTQSGITNTIYNFLNYFFPYKALSYDQVIERAKKEFTSNPNAEQIINRIAQRLKEENYEQSASIWHTPQITLNWTDTLWIQSQDISKQDEAIIIAATQFITQLPNVKISELK